MGLIKGISYLVTDNKSGSSSVLKNIILTLLNYCNTHKTIRKSDLIETLNFVFSKYNQFAVLYHFINYLFQYIEKHNDNSESIECIELNSCVKEYLSNWGSANNKIGEQLKKLFEINKYKNVFLHSNSSTITESFAFLAKQNIKLNIYQTVSYPAEEGKTQALKLAEQKHKVNLITDAAFGKFIGEIDCAILGADVVFEKSFINKTGSLLITENMRLHHIPVYIIFDSRKFISNDCNNKIRDNFKTEKPKPPEEIWRNPPLGINIINYYFEEIPFNNVNLLICEYGIFNANQIPLNLHNHFSKYFRI